jgi:hypothetical protein
MEDQCQEVLPLLHFPRLIGIDSFEMPFGYLITVKQSIGIWFYRSVISYIAGLSGINTASGLFILSELNCCSAMSKFKNPGDFCTMSGRLLVH